MEYRRLGKAGLKVSTLSFGAWVTFGQQYGEDLAYDIMKAARDAGVNFFDNAEAYANGRAEEVMGSVLKRAGWTRSDLVISTKIFWGGDGPNDRGLSMKHITEGVNRSLRRLQLEYVDLIFCHRPDRHTPIEETVRAMTQVIQQGKAFYWGTSEWDSPEIMHAYAIARQEHLIPPSMEQPEYNMFERKRVELEYAHLYQEIGLGTTIWSPLASGLLTGKYNDGMPKDTRASLPGYEWLKENFEKEEAKRNIEKVKQLMPIAKDLGCSMAQMAIAWCAKNPNVSTVITGASRPEQVVENMKAMDVVARLTPDVIERIEKVLNNKPIAEDR
ncbi:MAG TPA: aldo/keto reductase [Anaerolineae bacterium]|nr:aldo/keto reductase [Anaerolineae bacterium]